jgi:hypothetical protein
VHLGGPKRGGFESSRNAFRRSVEVDFLTPLLNNRIEAYLRVSL